MVRRFWRCQKKKLFRRFIFTTKVDVVNFDFGPVLPQEKYLQADIFTWQTISFDADAIFPGSPADWTVWSLSTVWKCVGAYIDTQFIWWTFDPQEGVWQTVVHNRNLFATTPTFSTRHLHQIMRLYIYFHNISIFSELLKKQRLSWVLLLRRL